MKFEQCWRWFGSYDTIELSEIKQTGAGRVVTVLHHLPTGVIWSSDEIQNRKREIEDSGLTWSVVESIEVHEDIKKQTGDFDKWITNYCQSIRNLAECGINTVCYNFIPLTGWTRTNIHYELQDGSTTLRFNQTAFAAFDLFILQHKAAESEYPEKQKIEAKKYFDSLNEKNQKILADTILLGIPGDEKMTVEKFKDFLSEYDSIDEAQLRKHLHYFLKEIIPVAEKYGVRMAIHPNDPPFSLFGLPNVLGTETDARELLNTVESSYNGLTFCTGSYGARADNDLVGMVKRLGHRINFIHLRNVQREDDGSFYESKHLEGDVDMFEVMHSLIKEQKRRKVAGRTDLNIPMRADHGQRMLDDQQKKLYPGYSGLGRMRGLAELRGLEMGIRKMRED